MLLVNCINAWVTSISCMYLAVRGYLTRRKIKPILKARSYSLKIIQAWARGYLVRKYFNQWRNKRQASALTIQRSELKIRLIIIIRNIHNLGPRASKNHCSMTIGYWSSLTRWLIYYNEMYCISKLSRTSLWQTSTPTP